MEGQAFGGSLAVWNQWLFFGSLTLPETNMAPENRPLEKEILIGNHHFQVLC